MRIIKFLLSLFGQEKRIVVTLDEARRNAKACYLNEDRKGVERWNEIIAKMVVSNRT